jgi:hypothetical protein
MDQRHFLPASGGGLKVMAEVPPEHKSNAERDYRNGECALDL